MLDRLDLTEITIDRHEPYPVVVNSDWADVSSTDSSESHEAVLPFADIDDSLVQAQQAGNVLSNVRINTQQQTYISK